MHAASHDATPVHSESLVQACWELEEELDSGHRHGGGPVIPVTRPQRLGPPFGSGRHALHCSKQVTGSVIQFAPPQSATFWHPPTDEEDALSVDAVEIVDTTDAVEGALESAEDA